MTPCADDTPNVSTPWMTYDEAAAYLKLNVRTFRNYVTRGLVPVCISKTTGTRRFRKDDLDLWLTDGK